jgi:hypothetical protein
LYRRICTVLSNTSVMAMVAMPAGGWCGVPRISNDAALPCGSRLVCCSTGPMPRRLAGLMDWLAADQRSYPVKWVSRLE